MHIRLTGGLELPLGVYEQCVSCLVTSLVTDLAQWLLG